MVLNRVIVIGMLCEKKLATLTKEQREDLLLDWWGLDDEDEAFEQLPDELKLELLSSEMPRYDAIQKRYDPLIFLALKYRYEGVTNEYIANEAKNVLGRIFEVCGEIEDLYECPCCNYKTLHFSGEYDICPLCHWEDDGMRETNQYSAVNHMTLLEGRRRCKQSDVLNIGICKYAVGKKLQ